MDKQTVGIGLLSLTGLLLLVANFLPTGSTTLAATSVHEDRGYHMVTSRNVEGGETLYIINRDGKVAALNYDANAVRINVLAGEKLPEVFARGK